MAWLFKIILPKVSPTWEGSKTTDGLTPRCGSEYIVQSVGEPLILKNIDRMRAFLYCVREIAKAIDFQTGLLIL